MSGELGLKEVLAMGLGGIIGGGIFAALGVAARIAGNAAFLSYLLAGAVALASGYSYVKLTRHFHEEGGSFTFLEHYYSNRNVAGVAGWTLIAGYIGTMAMYAYAFGSFAAGILGLESFLVRGLISAGIVMFFVAVNFLGVEKSGLSEDVLVYAKIAILGLFGLFGFGTLLFDPSRSFFPDGIFNHGIISPVVAAGVIFVSFEGFQLLTYEYREMKNGIETLRKGVLGSIILSSLVYVIIAFLTTSILTPEHIIQHKETVLAFAAGKLFASPFMVKGAELLVSLAALFSTASAINATLFGTARLGYRLATENELPGIFSFRNRKGVPTRSLALIGILTALFTATGSLEEVTAFASVAFITVFGTVNYLTFKDNEIDDSKLVPAAGLLGSIAALIALLWHFTVYQPYMLAFIASLVTVFLVLELLYFEREPIEKEAEKIEKEVENEVEKIEEEMEEEFDE